MKKLLIIFILISNITLAMEVKEVNSVDKWGDSKGKVYTATAKGIAYNQILKKNSSEFNVFCRQNWNLYIY